MRRTASAIRAIGSRPDRAAANVEAYSAFQLAGAMYMSSPAAIDAGQSVGVQPGTLAWPSQSPTTRPSNPQRRFSTPVSRSALPCILMPFQLEKLAITACTPAFSAARYGGAYSRISVASSARASPRSRPFCVPPSAMKCLAVAMTWSPRSQSFAPRRPCKPST